jgi:acyl-coenzyme A synthetase/AMP-(fatty) acid ligase
MCVNSGDRLPQALMDAWEKETGQVMVNQLGNTEMLIPLTLNWDGTTSVGKPVDGYRFTLVDEEGHELEDNEVGRLLIQGPSRSLGYWRDPEWTQRTYTEWLITGDSFWRDKHGDYHYMGRVGDVIKVSGNWVNPVMIEETLQHHEDIEQAAVVSKEGENGVHRIEAYIVTKPGARPDNLRRWVLREHDRHSCPRQFHIVPELPRTDSGKIQRYKLRA